MNFSKEPSEEATFQEVLDISLVYREIGIWQNSYKCQMLDTQGFTGELVWVTELKIHHDG